jgi:PEP-CTERM motif
MITRHTLVAFFVVSAPAAAFANSPGQGAGTGEFVTACAGLGTGGGVQGGESIFVNPPNSGGFGMFAGSPVATCNWSTGGITGGTLTQSASLNTTFQALPTSPVLNYSGSAQGSVTPGVLHLQSTTTGPAAVPFPTAVAQGGWTDQLDVTGQNPGTQGMLVFKVHVDGELDSSGPLARPGFTVTPYVNGSLVSLNAQFEALNPTPVIGSGEGLGYQSRVWFNPDDFAHTGGPPLIVNQDVLFAIPFTFGTAFDLGLYAYTVSGNGSFGQDFTVNTAQSLFQNTIALDGIEEVLAGPGETPITDYTIEALSGLDYTASQIPGAGAAPTPEPATWALLIVGGGLLGALRRQRSPKAKTVALS